MKQVSKEGTLTLKLMSPFLQHKQASMRKINVKRPEKETATTASEDGHDSSLRGAPPTGPKQWYNRYDGDIILPACCFMKDTLGNFRTRRRNEAWKQCLI